MTQKHSAIIKGIAILFMMLCHLDYVAGHQLLGGPFFKMLTNASHMIYYCLIISGYGLYLKYRKNCLNCSYLFKRSFRLYISFWLVLLFFVVGLGSLLYPGRFSYSWYSLVTNFIGWRWDYCNFTWFLVPYVLMTFCAGPVFKILDRWGDVVLFVIGAFLYLASSWMISRFYLTYFNHHYFVYHLVLLVQTLFGLIIGAILARLTLDGISLRIKWFEGKSWLVVLIFLFAYFLRGQIQLAALNPFFAILVVLMVINVKWPRLISVLLSSLGDRLMMMWFIQGFVGAFMFKEYYQLLHWPFFIYLAWVGVTYLVACIFTLLSNKLARALKL